MELLRLPDAAHALGVSYPTLKQWIYRRRIRSIRTAGGHHRIPRSEIQRLTHLRSPAPASRAAPSGLDAISGRNKLLGTITDLKVEGLLAQVTLDIGGQAITSIITRAASRALGLKNGMQAVALMKATEVMIIRG